MALIDCPECGTQVSSAAPSCPKCGFPIGSALAKQEHVQVAPPTASAPKVQTVEQTSKIWKSMELLGVVLTFGGCGSYFVGDFSDLGAARLLAMVAGVLLWATGSVLAWWHHG